MFGKIIKINSMKKNGNSYLLELFAYNEKKLLDYIFSSIHFFDNKLVESLNSKIDSVRKTKDLVTYYEKNGSFIKMSNVNSKLSSMKKYAKKNNLYVKNGIEYDLIKLDSTGNYALTKVMKSDLKIVFSKKETDWHNYNISHIWNKPNSIKKHCFTNIVIVPTFLDHFINKGLVLNNKNILNIIKIILINYYSLSEESEYNDISKITESEKKYAENLIKNKKLNIISK